MEKLLIYRIRSAARYNPGGHFAIANNIMDNPGDAKYGMTREQMTEAYKILLSKGVKHFGMHAFLASNTVTNDYYPELARILISGSCGITGRDRSAY